MSKGKAYFTEISGLWKRGQGKPGLTGRSSVAAPVIINPGTMFFVDLIDEKQRVAGGPMYRLKIVLDVDEIPAMKGTSGGSDSSDGYL